MSDFRFNLSSRLIRGSDVYVVAGHDAETDRYALYSPSSGYTVQASRESVESLYVWADSARAELVLDLQDRERAGKQILEDFLAESKRAADAQKAGKGDMVDHNLLSRSDIKILTEAVENMMTAWKTTPSSKLESLKAAFDVELKSMSPSSQRLFSSALREQQKATFDPELGTPVRKSREERIKELEKSFEMSGETPYKPATTKAPTPLKKKVEKDDVVPYTPEKQEHKPATYNVKWKTVKDTPGIKRMPSNDPEDTGRLLKVMPVVTEMLKMPAGRDRQLGQDTVDAILDIAERNLERNQSLEHFIGEAWGELPLYYNEKKAMESLHDLGRKFNDAKDATAQEEIQKLISAGEIRLEHIKQMATNLKAIYENWGTVSMKKQSNLVKKIGNFELSLGDRDVTLVTPVFTASLKFASINDACLKFASINTEEEVKTIFEVDVLSALEKKAESSLDSIIKPDTKGPSAEEQKAMMPVIVNHLNASNKQGTEEDITNEAANYVREAAKRVGAPYDDENIARVAREAYAEWKGSQPVPSEVGAEGKAGMGVANDQGTGVFVEPNRGNTNVQNQTPTNVIRKEANCILCNKSIVSGTSDYRTLKGEACNDHSLAEINKFMMKEAALEIIARVVKREDGWHVMSEKGKHLGGPYGSRAAAKKRLQQVEMFKHMKGATLETTMFNAGDLAILNTRVGHLNEGTEVEVTEASETEVTFVAGDVLGVTKAANLDKVAAVAHEGESICNCEHMDFEHDKGNACKHASCKCTKFKKAQVGGTTMDKIAAKDDKYPWTEEKFEFKFTNGDRVRIGSIEVDGVNQKGQEGTIREKVIMAVSDTSEKFYLVEVDGGGNMTLPEECLSKAGKGGLQAWRDVALTPAELKKEAVLKPNFEVTQEFLKSFKIHPTVVTTADIEAWLTDPKQNYQYSKKDLKEIVKYLQSAKVEVRVPAHKEAPEELPEEAELHEDTLGGPKVENEVPSGMKKEAKTYKAETIAPDGSKTTTEKEINEDMGPSFETEDPSMPGQKMKWMATSSQTAEAPELKKGDDLMCPTCKKEKDFCPECMKNDNPSAWFEACNTCDSTGAVCTTCKKK